MLNAEKVKKFAKQMGADLVGITSMDRFEGAPKEQDPRYIFPEAKSCIVLAFRIPRGYLRGIEEGTYFSAYTSMGYAGINEVYAPMVLREICCYLEDFGKEAVPLPNIYLRPSVYCDKEPGDPAVSIPVREGLPAPDVMIDMRVAAYLAGMGEFGWSKVFLTPEFGPLQRFVALITDAELEPDPIFEGHICDRCKSCVRMCTGQAISKDESEKIILAGHEVEFAKIDLKRCSVYYRGGDPQFNPFLETGTKEEEYNDLWFGSPVLEKKTGIDLYNRHGSALEGARGCMRECYIHLEKTGRLKKKFDTPFRKRKPWIIDRSKPSTVLVGRKRKSNDNSLL
jgi:ferredoxin